jgi:hypothetical protein
MAAALDGAGAVEAVRSFADHTRAAATTGVWNDPAAA